MGNPIEQIDVPRIREAFEILEATREEWPAPKHFLDALPRRPEREALDEPVMDDKTRADNKARLAKLMASIGD